MSIPLNNLSAALAKFGHVRTLTTHDDPDGGVVVMVELEYTRPDGEDYASFTDAQASGGDAARDGDAVGEGAPAPSAKSLDDDPLRIRNCTFRLTNTQRSLVRNAVTAAHKVAGAYSGTGNPNKAGNALAFIAASFLQETTGEGGYEFMDEVEEDD